MVFVLGHDVKVVDSYVSLRLCIDAAAGNETGIRRRIEMTRMCIRLSIVISGAPLSPCRPRSDLTIDNDAYILPILFYGADT